MKTIETDTTLTHFEEIEWPIIVTKPNIIITIDSDMSMTATNINGTSNESTTVSITTI